MVSKARRTGRGAAQQSGVPAIFQILADATLEEINDMVDRAKAAQVRKQREVDEAEARRKADEQRQAEAEVKKKADEDVKKKADEEARRLAQEQEERDTDEGTRVSKRRQKKKQVAKAPKWKTDSVPGPSKRTKGAITDGEDEDEGEVNDP